MNVVQEHPSVNGKIRRTILKNVESAHPVDNIYLGEKLHEYAIKCVLEVGVYNIGFFVNEHARNRALNEILNNKVTVLEYNKYFDQALIPNAQARSILLSKGHELFISLQIATSQISNDINVLQHLDAFTLAPRTLLNNIRLAISMPINNLELASIWAKTLRSPRDIPKWGMGKLQYWQILTELNNEQFNKVHSYRRLEPCDDSYLL